MDFNSKNAKTEALFVHFPKEYPNVENEYDQWAKAEHQYHHSRHHIGDNLLAAWKESNVYKTKSRNKVINMATTDFLPPFPICELVRFL